ncbi:MAG: quinone-dependent dihydroorotate dehydrogenase [Bacteroidota bacterium]
MQLFESHGGGNDYLCAMLYPLLRSLLFALPPEQAHHVSMRWLSAACAIPPGERLLTNCFRYPFADTRMVCGLPFRNPVGLGAGFDKNASYLPALKALGFGFVEIGTVTPLAQAGNEKPRLFRLPADEALINRMGFNNDGMDAVKRRLSAWNDREAAAGENKMIVGGNIGKNKITENEDAWKDYLKVFRHLHQEADYFVVNVSSPNTPGLRALQEKEALLKITGNLQEYNQGQQHPKPLLLKMAPDLTTGQLDDILELSRQVPLNGLVATNTTIERNNLSAASKALSSKMGAGGLSGLPLRPRALEVLRYLKANARPELPIISSGGMMTTADALERLEAGAALIQIWTGFIYRGPAFVKNIGKTIQLNKHT